MDLAVFAKAQENGVDRHLVDWEETVTDDEGNQPAEQNRYGVVLDIIFELFEKKFQLFSEAICLTF